MRRRMQCMLQFLVSVGIDDVFQLLVLAERARVRGGGVGAYSGAGLA